MVLKQHPPSEIDFGLLHSADAYELQARLEDIIEIALGGVIQRDGMRHSVEPGEKAFRTVLRLELKET